MKSRFKKPPGPLDRLRIIYEKRTWATEEFEKELDKRPIDRESLIRWMNTLDSIDNEIINLEYKESLFAYDFKKYRSDSKDLL